MTFYDDMQGIATELLTEFKQGVISYVKVTPGSGPAHNPGPSVPVPTLLQGAVSRGIAWKYVNSGLGVASDLQVTHSVQAGVVPEINGFYDIDGLRYKVVNIVKKPAAGTTVAYVAIVRK